jgi:hypothetical protein
MAKRTCVLPPSDERRHFPRCRIDPDNAAHLVAHLLAGERCPAHIIDLSKGGISLVCDRCLIPGNVVALSLHHIPRRFACGLPVRVVFTEECVGAFLVGAAFTRELTDEEMAELV